MDSITSQLPLQGVGGGYVTRKMVDMVSKGQYELNCQQSTNYSSLLVREELNLVMSFLTLKMLMVSFVKNLSLMYRCVMKHGTTSPFQKTFIICFLTYLVEEQEGWKFGTSKKQKQQSF